MSRVLGRLAGKLSKTKYANKLKNKYADQLADKLSTSSFSNLFNNTPFGNNNKTASSISKSSIKGNKLGQVFTKHKTKIATFIIVLLILLIPLYLIIFKEILKYDRDGIQHTSPQNFYYIAIVIGVGMITLGLKKTAGSQGSTLFLKYIALFSGIILLTWVATKWNSNILFGLIVLYFVVNHGGLNKVLKIQRINSFNKVVFWVSVLYIIHILWVILTFTSPTITSSIDLPDEKRCNAPWLYYGSFPPSQYNKADQYHDYLFDITVWFPPEVEDNPAFTCQPCPTNQTPRISSNGTNLTCRPCNDSELWYSVNELNTMYKNDLLTDEQKNAIGNGGRTLSLEQIGERSLTTYHNDYSGDKFNEMNESTGMCLSELSSISSFSAYQGGSNCNSYENCMETAPAFIELSWPSDSPVYPDQLFELKNLDTPLIFRIPQSIYKLNQCESDPAYNSIYHNPICNHSVIHGQDRTRCHLKIPVDPTPYPKASLPPRGYRIERQGGSVTGEGPPCEIVNQLAQDYNTINGTAIPTSTDININDRRYVSEYTNSHQDNDRQTAEDWRNIIGLIYGECFSHNGRCYTHDYICETSKKSPIPMVDYNTSPTPILTLPDDTLNGCQNITKVDTCSSVNDGSVCQAIDVDEHGNVVEVSGRCKMAKWNNNNWEILPPNVPPIGYQPRCFIQDKVTTNSLASGTFSHPDSVIHNSILHNNSIRGDICRRAPRMTDPQIESHIRMQSPPCSPDQDSVQLHRSRPGSAQGPELGTASNERKQCSQTPPGTQPTCPSWALNKSNHYYDVSDYHSRCCLEPPPNQSITARISKMWNGITTTDPTLVQYPTTIPSYPFTIN
jgi:hypothetical protein